MADFAPGYDLAAIATSDVKLSLVAPAEGRPGALRVDSGHATPWPGLTLKAPGGKWNLGAYGAVALDLHNPGTKPAPVGYRIDNPGGDGGKHCIQDLYTLRPGERVTVRLKLRRRLPPEFGLFGMNGYPGMGAVGAGDHQVVDPATLTQMIIFADHPQEDVVFEVSRVRAEGEAPALPDPRRFFPFIDEFGQYRHADWPGKLHAIGDFALRRAEEETDLASHPVPADRDRWGGWKTGPKLRATGYFHPVKRGGRWWLVDPDGRLFWSYGVDCVSNWSAGPVEERDRWYEALPVNDPEYARFFWTGDARADERYKGKKVKYFDFGAANARRKYGTVWADSAADAAHRRLASWGFNTIGNWSSGEIAALKRTPYVVAIHFWAPELKGSEGYWQDFRDVFDPAFRLAVRGAMAGQKGKTAGDPWCIGYFVDNEISWGNETDLGVWTLRCPPEQPAKQAFVAALKKKYEKAAKLNAAWGTAHASWDALLASREAPDRAKAEKDLKTWTARTAEVYFKTCAEEVKRVAPKNLYLGCRFAWANDLAVKASAKYCDVVSYNLYRRTVEDFRLPAGLDKPVIIGEFHFGALDRGMFHTGLVPVGSQTERAGAFTRYLEGAVRNPVLVGAHWFQYIDEPTTGRFDGENYQIGLVDVCDTPYPETIAAARDVGARLFSIRK